MASSLILNPHASDIVKASVNDVAELLPVSFNGETWNLLNVFNVIDALDKENSQSLDLYSQLKPKNNRKSSCFSMVFLKVIPISAICIKPSPA